MRKIILLLVLLVAACGTIEKKVGCDLPEFPDQAFMWWDVNGDGSPILDTVNTSQNLKVERNQDGEVKAIYTPEARAFINAVATCQALSSL